MQDDGQNVALDPELLSKIKAIQVRTKRLVTDVMAGEYESTFKGRGMEFEEVRTYAPGDDIRHIDWNVTARTGVPHIKEFREERELTVILMVDLSASGAFGTVERFKNEVAAEVAAILTYAAIKSHDRVGLIIFSDRVEHFIPPKKGRGHVWRIIRDIMAFEPQGRRTDLEGALDFLNRVQRRRAVVFLISDFVDEGPDDHLRRTARKHDLTAISVTDPKEVSLPPIGLLELEDAETGEILMVDTSDPNTSRGFEWLARKARDTMRETFRSAGVREIEIRTDTSTVEPIVRFFRNAH